VKAGKENLMAKKAVKVKKKKAKTVADVMANGDGKSPSLSPTASKCKHIFDDGRECNNPQKGETGYCRHHIKHHLTEITPDKLSKINRVYGETVGNKIHQYLQSDPSDLTVELAILRKKLHDVMVSKEMGGLDSLKPETLTTLRRLIDDIAKITKAIQQIEVSKKYTLSINSVRVVIQHINNILITRITDPKLRNAIAEEMMAIPLQEDQSISLKETEDG